MSTGDRPRAAGDITTLLSTDLWLVLCWTGLVVVAAAVPGVRDSPLRLVLVGSWLLVVPGHLLLLGLFPRVDGRTGLERAVLGGGASISQVALLGILLNLTPFGVQAWTLLVTFVGYTLLLLGAVLFRLQSVPPDDRAAPWAVLVVTGRDLWATWRTTPTTHRLVVVLAGAFVVVATLYALQAPLPSEHYTEFYAVGPNGTVDSISEAPVESGSFALVVRNHEFETRAYTVEVTSTDGTVLWTDRTRLAHDEVWRTRPSLASVEPDRPVSVALYTTTGDGDASTDGEAYRTLRLWVETENG